MKKLHTSLLFALGLGTNLDSAVSPMKQLPYETLYALLPEFSESSLRGAVMRLKDKKLVSAYVRGGSTVIALTTQGRETLRTLFPAFVPVSRRDHQWTIAVLVSAPATDPTWRGIRLILRESNFFPLERGIWVSAQPMIESMRQRLTRAGALSSVVVTEVRRFIIGDDQQVLYAAYPIDRYIKAGKYLRSALEHLDERLAENKRLHAQTRQALLSALAKGKEYFSQDLVIPDLYLPQDIQLTETKRLFYAVGEKLLLHI